MDVVFVNAVYFSPMKSTHIGQFILRDILKDDYRVKCINFDYLNYERKIEYKETLQENVTMMGEHILSLNPKIVGFYTICNAFIVAIKLAKYIKEKNPDVIIMFGGPQATITAEECMREFDFLDIVSIGESELTIKPLVDALINKDDLKKISNIVYRDENQSVVKNSCLELISDSELSKYTVFDYSPFKISEKESFYLEGGRGCPFGCTFCTTSTFWGRKFRVKPIDALIDEMKKFNELYGVKEFNIVHDLFTANKEYVKEFCSRLISEKLNFKWACSSRIDVLDEETILKMKEANCSSIYLGIETGSERMQKVLNKNLKLDAVYETMRMLKEIGIEVTISFIYCFPDETLEDFEETFKMIEYVFLMNFKEVQLHRFIPLPKTIETEKIKEKMYFDETVIEGSMNNIKFMEPDVKKMILEYPDMFAQYYTFDSEVKDKYKRFDFLLELYHAVYEFYGNSLKYLIRKYGLKKFYVLIEDVLDEIYLAQQELSVSQRAEPNAVLKTSKVCKIVDGFILNEKEKDDSIYFEQLYKYEHNKYTYFIKEEVEPRIMEFSIDIGAAIKFGECVSKKYDVKYWRKEDLVLTKHVSPLYSVINKLKN